MKAISKSVKLPGTTNNKPLNIIKITNNSNNTSNNNIYVLT